MKKLAITYRVDSLLKDYRHFYSFDSVKAVFTHCGFVNQVDVCPDAHASMRDSNAVLSENPKLKFLFINSIFDCTLQMSMLLIGIPEKYFDLLKFPVNKDFSGREWTLKYNKAIFFRMSQPLTSRERLEEKHATLVKDFEEIR